MIFTVSFLRFATLACLLLILTFIVMLRFKVDVFIAVLFKEELQQQILEQAFNEALNE